ncbi:type II toxin-antitoxin system Phd/YefM family antitoxin [Candidatus Finniella inopinata]|uniref:Antitoxin n=1 Tax=Candidatus Finniella inopinata TaxID=1696036 RepID=A0A4Q7DGP1_9PROT|nr:type II toxin-antitoxin system Phd/YefM family antitoxin [Candidatus Finniella inopinata]
MTPVTITQARADLYKIVDQVCQNHTPTIIKGKRNNAVIVSEEDWKSIQETLYLLSVPGMYESIVEGQNEPLEEMLTESDLGW